MLEALRNGKSGMKNPRYNKIVSSLKWRQHFLGCEWYDLPLENGSILQLKQIENGEVSGIGTGATVWPAACVLSKYLEIRYGAHGLIGKRVCDIGSGTGVLGIVAAALGAEATLTDQACVFFLMQENKNAVCDAHPDIDPDRIRLSLYDWGESPPEHLLTAPVDIVIVSDCVLPKLYPIEPLVQAVSAVMGPDTIVLMSYEHRPYPYFDPRMEFDRLASRYGMKRRVIPISQHHPVFSCEDIEIWEVSKIHSESVIDTESSSSAGAEVTHPSKDCFGSAQADCMTGTANEGYRRVNPIEVLSWGRFPSVDVAIGGRVVAISQDVSGGVGCSLWPSSVILSRYILNDDYKKRFSNSGTVIPIHRPLAIDLGAGCGLTTLCLLLRGYDVICTDRMQVLPLLQENITRFIYQHLASLLNLYDLSGQDSSVNLPAAQVTEFDWVKEFPTSTSTIFDEGLGSACIPEESKSMQSDRMTPVDNLRNRFGIETDRSVDLIVCSDCLYASASVKPLLQTINELCLPGRTMLLMCNELRSAFDEFIRAFEKQYQSVVPEGPRRRSILMDVPLEPEDYLVYLGSGASATQSTEDHLATRPVRVVYSNLGTLQQEFVDNITVK